MSAAPNNSDGDRWGDQDIDGSGNGSNCGEEYRERTSDKIDAHLTNANVTLEIDN